MPIILEPALLNPIRFVEVKAKVGTLSGFPYTLPFRLGLPGYPNHWVHFDQDWHILSLEPDQLKVDYNQKWQVDDDIALQFNIPIGCAIAVGIYSCNGMKVADVELEASQTYEGNVVYGLPMSTYQYRFSYSGLMLNTGKYYVVVVVSEGEEPDIVTKTFVSEPQEIKVNHLQTILIEYDNDQNRYDTFFSMRPNFNIRVEARLPYTGSSYLDTDFTDQQQEQYITYSDAIRNYDLIIGQKLYRRPVVGVANWMIEKIANVLRCKFILLDSKQFVRVPNTDPEPVDYNQLPLSTATFKMREQNRKQNNIFGEIQARYTFPTDYPYMISTVVMGDVQLSAELQIDDITGLQAAVTSWNSITGLTGTFTRDGTTVIYINGRSERYFTITAVLMLKFFTFHIENTGDGTWNGIDYSGGSIVVDFGLGMISGNLQTYNSIGDITTVSKSYPGGSSDYNVTIWHNDTIEYLEFKASAPLGYSLESLNISEPLPAALSTLNVFDNYMLTTLHGSIFDNYFSETPNWKNIAISGSLTTFAPSDLFGFSHGLQYINFEGNALSSSAIEDMLSGLAGSYTALNGFIGLANQSPAAPPIGTTLGSLATLAIDGWTYTTD